MFSITSLLRKGQQPSAPTEFDAIISQTETRPLLASQMSSMARWYGLNKRQLSSLGWRLPWMIEECENCPVGSACFVDEGGKFAQRPGIKKESCPNAAHFKGLATGLGNRSHLRVSLS